MTAKAIKRIVRRDLWAAAWSCVRLIGSAVAGISIVVGGAQSFWGDRASADHNLLIGIAILVLRLVTEKPLSTES